MCHNSFASQIAVLFKKPIIFLSSDYYQTYHFTSHLIIKELSKATGAMGMAGGQAIDIQAIRLKLKENEVWNMNGIKASPKHDAFNRKCEVHLQKQ